MSWNEGESGGGAEIGTATGIGAGEEERGRVRKGKQEGKEAVIARRSNRGGGGGGEDRLT